MQSVSLLVKSLCVSLVLATSLQAGENLSYSNNHNVYLDSDVFKAHKCAACQDIPKNPPYKCSTCESTDKSTLLCTDCLASEITGCPACQKTVKTQPATPSTSDSQDALYTIVDNWQEKLGELTVHCSNNACVWQARFGVNAEGHDAYSAHRGDCSFQQIDCPNPSHTEVCSNAAKPCSQCSEMVRASEQQTHQGSHECLNKQFIKLGTSTISEPKMQLIQGLIEALNKQQQHTVQLETTLATLSQKVSTLTLGNEFQQGVTLTLDMPDDLEQALSESGSTYVSHSTAFSLNDGRNRQLLLMIDHADQSLSEQKLYRVTAYLSYIATDGEGADTQNIDSHIEEPVEITLLHPQAPQNHIKKAIPRTAFNHRNHRQSQHGVNAAPESAYASTSLLESVSSSNIHGYTLGRKMQVRVAKGGLSGSQASILNRTPGAFLTPLYQTRPLSKIGPNALSLLIPASVANSSLLSDDSIQNFGSHHFKIGAETWDIYLYNGQFVNSQTQESSTHPALMFRLLSESHQSLKTAQIFLHSPHTTTPQLLTTTHLQGGSCPSSRTIDDIKAGVGPRLITNLLQTGLHQSDSEYYQYTIILNPNRVLDESELIVVEPAGPGSFPELKALIQAQTQQIKTLQKHSQMQAQQLHDLQSLDIQKRYQEWKATEVGRVVQASGSNNSWVWNMPQLGALLHSPPVIELRFKSPPISYNGSTYRLELHVLSAAETNAGSANVYIRADQGAFSSNATRKRALSNVSFAVMGENSQIIQNSLRDIPVSETPSDNGSSWQSILGVGTGFASYLQKQHAINPTNDLGIQVTLTPVSASVSASINSNGSQPANDGL